MTWKCAGVVMEMEVCRCSHGGCTGVVSCEESQV